MSGLIRRLRNERSGWHLEDRLEAADEIERLRGLLMDAPWLAAELAEARKAALEEAARVCDKERDFLQKDGSGPFTFGGAYAAAKLAAAIRKRGESDD